MYSLTHSSVSRVLVMLVLCLTMTSCGGSLHNALMKQSVAIPTLDKQIAVEVCTNIPYIKYNSNTADAALIKQVEDINLVLFDVYHCPLP
jgi:hypothetical protein